MKPWELLESSPIPESKGVMELWRHDRELVIRVDGAELMSSRMHGSEDALAELACERVGVTDVSMLIGGLGMGFTLASALRCLDPDGHVVVAELVPAVIEWNRGPLANVAGRPLEDPRSSIHLGDVSDLIKRPPAPWDAILLDVDNGPDGMTREENSWLYSDEGLEMAWSSLREGGVLAVWSASPDDAFTKRMYRVGFELEQIPVRGRGTKGPYHVIWVGTRRGTKSPGR